MIEISNYSVSAQVWALRYYGKVGPRTFRVLLARFTNLEEVFKAEIPELIEIEGLGEKRCQRIYESDKYLDESEEFLKSLDSRNIKFSTLYDTDYPGMFDELNDPPPIIFYLGKLPNKDEKTVGIVGSHKATGEGIALVVELSKALSDKSISIISGFAPGIDTAAHIGALKNDGCTYAIIGSGLESIYEGENKSLIPEILKNGGILSEYPLGSGYSVGGLMARNRLVAGLSRAVVIGEVMADSSGTKDCARICHELGKLMFITIDGCERPGQDNKAVEEILALGAIPFSFSDGIDLIIKSLV